MHARPLILRMMPLLVPLLVPHLVPLLADETPFSLEWFLFFSLHFSDLVLACVFLRVVSPPPLSAFTDVVIVSFMISTTRFLVHF